MRRGAVEARLFEKSRGPGWDVFSALLTIPPGRSKWLRIVPRAGAATSAAPKPGDFWNPSSPGFLSDPIDAMNAIAASFADPPKANPKQARSPRQLDLRDLIRA